MNYYKVLGISANASEAQIKSAFKKLISIHHPDRIGTGNTEFAKVLIEAKNTLMDPARKAVYDAQLNRDEIHTRETKVSYWKSEADIESQFIDAYQNAIDGYTTAIEQAKAEYASYEIYDETVSDYKAAQRELAETLRKLQLEQEMYMRYIEELHGISTEKAQEYIRKYSERNRGHRDSSYRLR
jgi:DnaJ-class molecular chaperone